MTHSPSFSTELLQSGSRRYATIGSRETVVGMSSSDSEFILLPLSISSGNGSFTTLLSMIKQGVSEVILHSFERLFFSKHYSDYVVIDYILKALM